MNIFSASDGYLLSKNTVCMRFYKKNIDVFVKNCAWKAIKYTRVATPNLDDIDDDNDGGDNEIQANLYGLYIL